MNSSLIGKVQKAHQYAHEPERARIQDLTVQFAGDNSTHTVRYQDGAWDCDCHFFAGWGICCHTMGMELLLGAMITTRQRYPGVELPTSREVVTAG